MTLADARTDYYRRDENSDDHSLDRYFDDVDFIHGSSSSILNRRSVKMYQKAARTGEDSPLTRSMWIRRHNIIRKGRWFQEGYETVFAQEEPNRSRIEKSVFG